MAGEGLLGVFLGMLLYTTSDTTKKLNKKEEELKSYDPLLKERKDLVISRKKDIEKYNLHKIYELLEGKAQEAFAESMGCFLFGMDLAASNMICLAIEMFLRDKTNNHKDSLYKLIENLIDSHQLDPLDLNYFHALRKQRNNQVHTINRFDELTILGLYKTLKEIIGIFKEKEIKALME